MPIREETEEIEVTKTKTTTWYICDYPDCDESTKNFDPKGDYDVANPKCNVGHKLNYVALNPHPGTYRSDDFGEEDGVYLCDDHIGAAGELLEKEE